MLRSAGRGGVGGNINGHRRAHAPERGRRERRCALGVYITTVAIGEVFESLLVRGSSWLAK